MRRAGAAVALLAVIAAGCNFPTATDPIQTTTTTSTTSAPPATTTTVTLPPPDTSQHGMVTAVTDGDTITVSIDGVESEVRLLGINAPELDECYGNDAHSIVTRMIGGFDVVLVAGEEDADAFGRLLRDVYLEQDGKTTFVNAELVAEGVAVAVQGTSPESASLKEIEARAYDSGKGMWGTYVCGQPDGGTPDRPQIRVSDVSADPPGPDEDALDQEWIDIVNEGYGSVSLAGWIVRDESSTNRLTLATGTTLTVGDTLRVVTGCGSSGGLTVYWCADGPVWNNEGDTVILMDRFGNVVERFPYGPTG